MSKAGQPDPALGPCPECGGLRELQPEQRPGYPQGSAAAEFYTAAPGVPGDGDLIMGGIGLILDIIALPFRLFKRMKPAKPVPMVIFCPACGAWEKFISPPERQP